MPRKSQNLFTKFLLDRLKFNYKFYLTGLHCKYFKNFHFKNKHRSNVLFVTAFEFRDLSSCFFFLSNRHIRLCHTFLCDLRILFQKIIVTHVNI